MKEQNIPILSTLCCFSESCTEDAFAKTETTKTKKMYFFIKSLIVSTKKLGDIVNEICSYVTIGGNGLQIGDLGLKSFHCLTVQKFIKCTHVF